MGISLNKRIKALELYLRNNCSFAAFATSWERLYNQEICPNRKFMQRLLQRYRKYGNLENVKRKSNRPCRNEDTITDISAYFQINKGCSLRQFFQQESYAMSVTTLHKILTEDLGLKAYKCRKFHRLHGNSDYNDRYNMCKLFLVMIKNDSSLLSKIIWSDECFMKLNGTRNHHNIYWWASQNPHIYVEQSLNATGVMVFVGLTRYGPIGPFFFDELAENSGKKKKNSVSGKSYLELLVTKVIPEINDIFPKEIVDQFIFQLDGAPGHRTVQVKQCLHEHFPNRWWGNNGPIHWAARSPDLSPLGMFNLVCTLAYRCEFYLDFSFWGCLRENVYRRQPNTLQQLKQYIREETAKFSMEYFAKICLDAVAFRFEECRKSSGKSIEPFIA